MCLSPLQQRNGTATALPAPLSIPLGTAHRSAPSLHMLHPAQGLKARTVTERHGQISPVSSLSPSPQPGETDSRAEKVLGPFDTSSSGSKAIRLPSLCDQFDDPEPHPDFHIVMASLSRKVQLFREEPTLTGSHTSAIHLPPLSLVQPRTVPSMTLKRLQPSTACQTPQLPDVHLHQDNQRNGSEASLAKMAVLDELTLSRPAMVHASAQYKVTTARYVTNADPRGFLPVYEYAVLGHTLMIDMETSYVLLSAICKALGPTRAANVLRLVGSSAEMQPYIRRVEGGFLKIQGIWVPYSLARELARRVAWAIRFDLVPLFGFQFPTQCLSPNDSGFGDLRLTTGVRRAKRAAAQRDHLGRQPSPPQAPGTDTPTSVTTVATPRMASPTTTQPASTALDHLRKRPAGLVSNDSVFGVRGHDGPSAHDFQAYPSSLPLTLARVGPPLQSEIWAAATEVQRKRMREEGRMHGRFPPQ